MTPWLCLFCVAITVGLCNCLYFIWKLRWDIYYIQQAYIELLAKHEALGDRVAYENGELNALQRRLEEDHLTYKDALEGRLLAIEGKNGLTTLYGAVATYGTTPDGKQELRDQAARARILMYQISASENLAGNKAPTLYGR